ncbi:MAG: hypothetical protein JST36_05625 [Bacteroidetes bacterium]|nr:hypothetical protein [Bacteroidota bacterium]
MTQINLVYPVILKQTSLIVLSVLMLIAACKKDNDSSPIVPPKDDTLRVTVTNGYGGGVYQAGDTVHVFSSLYGDAQLFDHWAGADASLLNSATEWHTWFIMPNRSVSLNGTLKSVPTLQLNYRQIKGRDRMKPVFYSFPTAAKGVVYLLHGTGGNANVLVGNYEWQQLMKDLLSNGFGVIVTEAEESTTGVDANGDGKIRWAFLPADSNLNVDFANIKAITDTLIQRGTLDAGLPRYSLGMSAGGFFSAALAYTYNYKASIQFCAQGSDNLMTKTTIPTMFCMASNDQNPEVGAAGNAEAYANATNLQARSVCSKYLLLPRCPIFPDRFARSGDIAPSVSDSVFRELQQQGYIDARGNFVRDVDSLKSLVATNPPNLPFMNSLSALQKSYIFQQINQCMAAHSMTCDFDRAVLAFLNDPCH